MLAATLIQTEMVSPRSVCIRELQLNFDEVLSTCKSGINPSLAKNSKRSKGEYSVNKRNTNRSSLKVHSMQEHRTMKRAYLLILSHGDLQNDT